jgi:hypothetical protein
MNSSTLPQYHLNTCKSTVPSKSLCNVWNCNGYIINFCHVYWHHLCCFHISNDSTNAQERIGVMAIVSTIAVFPLTTLSQQRQRHVLIGTGCNHNTAQQSVLDVLQQAFQYISMITKKKTLLVYRMFHWSLMLFN